MAKAQATTLVLNDGRELLVDVSHPTPGDLVALEDRFDISADELGGEDSRLRWTLFLLWRTASRSHPDIAATPFEEFIEMVADLIEDEVDEPDPTLVAPIG